ncbi:hypothetical protein GOP47_0012810 [Adiantum capillus-veneris]|uniref:Uncharacterized protein n=1 Tax=Adiantum capillus-veneris TaxID=13818 RepID=A0A9D4URU1_ADICA|nr:hypothetical protein GOP47_0012810 [Adiantum capillus-veneris]
MDERMPTSSPLTQGPLLRRSNLDCFLDHTTPTLQCHCHLQRNLCLGDAYTARTDCCKGMPSFSLSDLWMSFDEWSAYGVGVPLVLPCGETIVQYYVPYLSAVQIYLQTGYSFSPNKRRQGDDSDWSDVSDGRESSNDAGSDNETTLRIKSDQWDSSSCVSFERLSYDSVSSEGPPDLFFEYFERGSPYNRAPLAGKISELAADAPHLFTLNSNELLPASWFSVAWYPIYRIPMGSTMSDLSTCFLTFHALWTPPIWQGQNKLNKGLLSPYEHGNNVCLFDLEQQSRKEQEQWLRGRLAWRLKRGASTLELPAFGMASYKLNGLFGECTGPGDKQRVADLAASADEWLRQLRAQHPDFQFFASREGMIV